MRGKHVARVETLDLFEAASTDRFGIFRDDSGRRPDVSLV
jgi:hypothetical protein